MCTFIFCFFPVCFFHRHLFSTSSPVRFCKMNVFCPTWLFSMAVTSYFSCLSRLSALHLRGPAAGPPSIVAGAAHSARPLASKLAYSHANVKKNRATARLCASVLRRFPSTAASPRRRCAGKERRVPRAFRQDHAALFEKPVFSAKSRTSPPTG